MARFDANRVIRLAEAIRGVGVSEQMAALDRLAEEMVDSGWDVRRTIRKGRGDAWCQDRRIRLIYVALCLVGLWMTRSMGQERLWLWPLFVIPLMVPISIRRSGLWDAIEASRNDKSYPWVVIASRIGSASNSSGWRTSMFIAGGVVLLAGIGLELNGGWPFRILILAGFGYFIVAPLGPSPSHSSIDDRLGPAMLAELARTWPRSARSRLDVSFVAVTAEASLNDRRSARPQLLVEVLRPGLGPRIQIGGTIAGRELAIAAAKDLWMPTTSSVRSELVSLPEGTTHIVLQGVIQPEASPDLAAMARTAQLIVELALRWAKR